MAGEIRSYRDLRVWQAAVEASLEVYRLTAAFPVEERFGLTIQLRRASVSVPSNIAEGYGRGTKSDYLRFLRVARGSLYEVETQLLIAARLGFLSEDGRAAIEQQLKECGRMLAALIKSVDTGSLA